MGELQYAAEQNADSAAETAAETPRSHPTLKKALVAAQRSVKAVVKKAKNSHHGYNYASADAIIDEAMDALTAEGLGVIPVSVDRDPAQVDHVWQKATIIKDGVETDDSWIIVPRRIKAVYKLIHDNSDEEREFSSTTPVIPEKGRPEDKAEFGARTENLGYALRDLLNIPREDMAQNTPSARDDRGYQNRGPAKAPPPSSQPPPKAAAPKAEAPQSSAPTAATTTRPTNPAGTGSTNPTPSANGSATSAEQAQALDMPTADQMDTISTLFGQLGMSKPAARAELQAVTGKESPFKMTRGDADKLIAHLRAKMEQQPAGAA